MGLLVTTGLAVGLAIPGVAGAGGRGITSGSAGQILKTAVRTTSSISSVTISGTVQSGKQRYGIAVTVGSGRGGGTVSLNQQEIDLVEVNNTIYFKGSAAFWQQFGGGVQAASLLANRWISAPSNDAQFGQFGQFLNVNQLFGGLFSHSLDPNDVFTNLGSARVNGVSAVKIRVANAKKPDENALAYVATSGPPYVLRIVALGAGSSGHLDLTNFDEPVNVQPPNGAVSIQSLQQAGNG